MYFGLDFNLFNLTNLFAYSLTPFFFPVNIYAAISTLCLIYLKNYCAK